MVNQLYSELAINDGAFRRGKVIPWGQMPPVDRVNPVEMFRGYFALDEEGKAFIEKTGSIKDIPTSLYCPIITLDLDSPNELTACELAERVKRLYALSDVALWFSGTGFHIEFQNPFIWKGTSKELIQKLGVRLSKDFPECDSIYDYARLIRLPYTWNKKSNLWKTKIEERGLLPSLPPPSVWATSVTADERLPLEMPSPLRVGVTSNTPTYQSIDVSAVVSCMQHAYNAGPIGGERHKTVLRLASAWRRQGLTREACKSLAVEWVNDSGIEAQRLVDQVFDRPYVFGCHDEIMVKWCDPKCIFYKNKNLGLDISHPEDMNEELGRYISQSLTKRSLDLSKIYKLPSDRQGRPGEFGIYPGEFVAVLGDTGVGKTTWIQNLCMNAGHLQVLFLSLEVHKPMLYRRFLQMANVWSKEQVYEYFENTGQHNGVASKIGHIRISSGHTDLLTLERLISTAGADLIVIDTLDGISVSGARNDLEKTEQLGVRLKEIAQKTNTIIIGVHHISKAAAFSALEHGDHLTVHSGKGSSSIEQKADKVISVEGRQDQAYRRIRSLKARDESGLLLHMTFDPTFFIFEQIGTQPATVPLTTQGVSDGSTGKPGNSGPEGVVRDSTADDI